MNELESLTISGDPHERGFKHGEVFSTEIDNNAEFYYQYFAENGVDKTTARNHAKQYIQDIKESYPIYANEIEGVAEGSDLSIEDITIISLRHTILYSAYMSQSQSGGETGDNEPNEPRPTGDDCTSFGVESVVTASDHTYIGQNWDWKPPVEVFIMDLQRDDHPNAIVMTEAGNVFGKFGVNEYGIGFAANGLSTPNDGDHPFRKPSHIRGRQIIDSQSFDQALKAVVAEDRPTSRNYVIGQADGEIVDIETTPDSCYYIYPEDHILTHANHFENRTTVNSEFEKQVPDSIYRAKRLQKALSTTKEVNVETIQTGLQDHFGKPMSVCRHKVEDGVGMESCTKVSLIMDLDEKSLLATNGPPCKNSYHKYSVSN